MNRSNELLSTRTDGSYVVLTHQVLCNFFPHKNANNSPIYLTCMSSFLGAACLDGFVLHGNGTKNQSHLKMTSESNRRGSVFI